MLTYTNDSAHSETQSGQRDVAVGVYLLFVVHAQVDGVHGLDVGIELIGAYRVRIGGVVGGEVDRVDEAVSGRENC